jgi:hypothetical protein
MLHHLVTVPFFPEYFPAVATLFIHVPGELNIDKVQSLSIDREADR